MFSKASKTETPLPPATQTTQPAAAPKSSGVPSIISSDLKITGNLESNGDLQVDGEVNGDITSQSLTVGEEAHVQGGIRCESVRICGKVSGEVRGDSVVLEKTAKVAGDIVHKSLAIEAGAYIEGNIRRIDSEPASGASKVSVINPIKDNTASVSEGPKVVEQKPATG